MSYQVYIVIELGPVVQSPISTITNPGLTFNKGKTFTYGVNKKPN